MAHTISCCPTTTKALLVLLRIAIGWHLLYEGMYKLETRSTAHPWSARWYLQNSEGPASGIFRALVPEAAPTDPFDQPAISAYWTRIVDRYADYFTLDPDQYESAQSERRFFEKRLQSEVLDDPLMQAIIQEHARLLHISPAAITTSEQARFERHRRQLQSAVDGLTEKLEIQLRGLLEPEQRALGDSPAGRLINTVDRLVVWGLVILGGCLMIGLFSRLAAVAGAGLLLSFYVAMPPLPGLTSMHVGSAHYLYVNATLIEAMALLALSTTQSGLWAGLDIIVGKIRTGVEAARTESTNI